jgi:hypothetical protein
MRAITRSAEDRAADAIAGRLAEAIRGVLAARDAGADPRPAFLAAFDPQPARAEEQEG